jgi:hypothetical protein
MDNGSSNRIGSTSLTVTTPRQTPMNDFGQVMARTVSGAVQLGAVAGAFIPGAPVVSAAISGVASMAAGMSGLGASASAMTRVGPTSAGTSGGAAASGKGEGWDLHEAQKLLASETQSFNKEYLALQNQMQRESREFTTLSNIMKVRHDSAKAAINNIR